MMVISMVMLGACESADPAMAGAPKRSCVTTLATHAGEVGSVYLEGEWIAGAGETDSLKRASDGVWSTDLSIPTGRYLYRLIVDGESRTDPDNPLTLFGSDGREMSVLDVPSCAQPAWRVDSFQSGAASWTAELVFVSSHTGELLDEESLRIDLDGEPPAAEVDPATGRVRLSAPCETGKHRILLSARDTRGIEAEELAIPFWCEPETFDWRRAVIYQIVTDRFARADAELDPQAGMTERMGGNWSGITRKIEEGYFDRLGVNALWISPAVRNADGLWPGFDGREYESYHGYWPISSRDTELRFGGEAALQSLIEAAHAKGIRIILDAVPNHVHLDHPYYRDHREWFNYPEGDCVCGRECRWDRDIQVCWFTEYLPDLDWRNAHVVETIISDLLYWMTTYRLDGLRIDAVPMMPRLMTRHLRAAVRTALERGGTPAYLIGETYTSEDGRSQIRYSLGPYGLSGQFDFPLMWTLLGVVAQGTGGLADLLDAVDESQAAWAGSGAVMGLILGNHDVPRFLSVADGAVTDDPQNPPGFPSSDLPYDKLALAAAFLYTQPGAPILYYGDEIGLPGGRDPDNRRPMRFAPDWSNREEKLFSTVSRLGRLRRASPVLALGRRTDLVRQKESVAFLLETDASFAIVVLSRASGEGTLNVPLAGSAPDRVTSDPRVWKDCFGHRVERNADRLTLSLEPYSFAIIMPEAECHD